MKWKLGLGAASMAAGMLAAATTASAEPPSYPLSCVGGPGMKIMVAHDVDAAGRPGATAMTIFFRAAGTAGAPGPGECVWFDRTFRPGEPESMWIKSPNVEFAFQVMGDGRVAVDGTGPRLNAEGARISAEARSWDKLVQSVLRGGRFTVQVYNGGTSMIITRIGP